MSSGPPQAGPGGEACPRRLDKRRDIPAMGLTAWASRNSGEGSRNSGEGGREARAFAHLTRLAPISPAGGGDDIRHRDACHRLFGVRQCTFLSVLEATPIRQSPAMLVSP